ncbi:MAG: rhomboid family intramembrane serine protease [Flammeovirgaceae bacterium]
MTITVTMFMIALICAISLYAENNPQVKAKLILNPYRTLRMKEYYRLLSSGFIHGGLNHLIFNMFTLYFFGEAVEQTIGAEWFIALFLIGIIVSDLPTFFKYKDLPHYNSLGASGGVSAILFCSIVFDPIRGIGFIIFIPGFIFGAIYLIYSYYQSKRSNDNINHDAHMYGALFGILYAFIASPALASQFLSRITDWITYMLS